MIIIKVVILFIMNYSKVNHQFFIKSKYFIIIILVLSFQEYTYTSYKDPNFCQQNSAQVIN